MLKKTHLLFWIIFPIVFTLLSAILIFLFDLTNGPLIYFILEIIFLIGLLVFRIMLIKKKFLPRLLLWLAFFAVTAGTLSLSKPTVEPKSAAYYKNPVAINETLKLDVGEVKGIYNEDKTVEIYAGIPYAKAERWKLPEETSWEGVRDGSYFGAKSMQPKSNPIMNSLVDIYAEKGWHPNYFMNPEQNKEEGALYLNIWRPVTSETNLPILVYIHGGSLTNGSGADNDINGEAMAKKGVIMITIQYRLGVFGYLAHPDLKLEALSEKGHATTGNYGLLDQIAALKWVNEHADEFNGDKDNITIAGESAGSSSVSALCTSPLAENLFKRAIGESSSLVIKKAPHTFRSEEDAYKTSENILKEFNCANIEELRKVPAAKLVETQYSNSGMMIDGYALKKHPYEVYQDHKSNEEALLNGYNVKEADAFVVPSFLFSPTNKNNIKERLSGYFDEETANSLVNLYKKEIEEDAFSTFNEIISVYWFIMPHHSWSNMALESGKTVYRYQFTKDNGYYGTYHSGEIIYCYGNLDKSRHQFAYDSSDYKLSEIMLSYWANFIKNGNPNGSGLPEWKNYTNSIDKVQELGTNVGAINDRYLSVYEIIDAFIDKQLEK